MLQHFTTATAKKRRKRQVFTEENFIPSFNSTTQENENYSACLTLNTMSFPSTRIELHNDTLLLLAEMHFFCERYCQKSLKMRLHGT